MAQRQSVAEQSPRLHMKLMRNHFSTQSRLYAVTRGLLPDTVVGTYRNKKSNERALWASQRQTAYRFGHVNAVFNPAKDLLGDDPNCLKEGRHRTWLTNT